MNRYSAGNNWLSLSAFSIPLLPLFLLGYNYPLSPYYISPLDFVWLWLCGLLVSYGLIAVHETGHAIAGYLVGIEITDLTIGHWRKLFTFNVGSVLVTIRAAPSTGYVSPVASSALFSAPRFTFFLLAGVLAEAWVIALTASLPAIPQLDSLGATALELSRLNVFCIGGTHIVFNLLPRRVSFGGTLHFTDGLQLLDFWRTRPEHGARKKRLAELLEVNALCSAKKFPAARDRLLAMLAQELDDGLLSSLGNLHVECGEFDQAEAIWRGLLAKPGLTSQKLAETLDALCCLLIFHGRNDLLPEADAWSTEALRHSPYAITLKGTRGSILIELGRIDAGIQMLNDVLKRSECPTDRAISSAYLAKACAAKGDRTVALQWLEKSRALNPDHLVVKRIAAELSVASASST